jgi:NADH dehydrogenase
MQENTLTIFGGSGFIASEIVYKLSNSFKEIRLLTRNTQACNHLKVIKNIQIHLYDPSNVSSYSIHLNESDTVINTVGILNESRKHSFDDIHFNFVRKIINKSKESSVKKFIQLSALNADENGLSKYLQSKGKADKYISSMSSTSFKTVILRPSIVFGEKDSFFNRFKSLLKLLPVFPLACPNSMFSPIYVKDLTGFIKEASLTDKYDNTIQNVTGPKDYKFIELINFILSTMKIKRLIIPLNYSLSKLQAFAFTYLPGNIFTLDNFKSLQVDNISTGGLKGTSSIEEFVPPYLNNKATKLDTYRKDSGR